jgi:hypothetical protein
MLVSNSQSQLRQLLRLPHCRSEAHKPGPSYRNGQDLLKGPSATSQSVQACACGHDGNEDTARNLTRWRCIQVTGVAAQQRLAVPNVHFAIG